MNTMHEFEWKSGICDCCFTEYCSTCCVAFFCPCFILGENYRLLKQLNPKVESFAENFSCCTACDDRTRATWVHGVPWILGSVGDVIVSYAFLMPIGYALQSISCLSFLFQCQVRGLIRNSTNLKQDCCNDCCCSMFCHSCALAQERKHLALFLSTSYNPINSMYM